LESGQDYAQGLALYDVHGRSEVVRKLLAYGETAFTRGKLVAALQQLVADVRVNVSADVRVNAEKPSHVEKTDIAVDPQRRAWFAERNYLHPQLEHAATDAERCVIALRILELGDLISQSYDQAAPGAAPLGLATPGLEALTDAGEIRRLLANLKPQRSKLNKRPDRAADLARVEADIHLLETKLKP
jgi:hypothetical protein